MDPRVKFTSLLTTTLVIFAFLLLVGCAASKKDQFKQDMMAQGVKPLSSAQLKNLMGFLGYLEIYEAHQEK